MLANINSSYEGKTCWTAICRKAFKPDRAHFCRAMGRVVWKLRSQWACHVGPWVDSSTARKKAPVYRVNLVIEDSWKYMEPDQTKELETLIQKWWNFPSSFHLLLKAQNTQFGFLKRCFPLAVSYFFQGIKKHRFSDQPDFPRLKCSKLEPGILGWSRAGVVLAFLFVAIFLKICGGRWFGGPFFFSHKI